LRRFIPVMNARVNLAHLRPAKVICLDCKSPMVEEKTDKAPVIFLAMRTKMIAYKCPSCGGETERQVAIPVKRKSISDR
jgi:Zn finger protein HypA/HybF involved in hydrogenase expression